MNKNGIESKKDVFDRISDLIEQARRKVATTINEEMLLLYWNIGKVIKEQIMKSDRAEYGKQIVQSLTAQLVPRYGRGFSKRNLWYMIQLYEAYPILQSLLGEFNGLSWTHIINILPIKDKLKREFYANLLMKELEGRTDLRYIQELLGHKSSITAEMYLKDIPFRFPCKQ